MTPEQELRAAAERIRHFAVMLPTGPWTYNEHHEIAKSGNLVLSGENRVMRGLPEVCRHVALWDPIVVELVAKMFDEEAADMDRTAKESIYGAAAVSFVYDVAGDVAPILQLARAINREMWP